MGDWVDAIYDLYFCGVGALCLMELTWEFWWYGHRVAQAHCWLVFWGYFSN